MPTYSNQSSSLERAEKARMAWTTTASCSFCASSSGAMALRAAVLAHHRAVSQVLERVDPFRGRSDDERRLQRGDRLVLGEAHQDVHRFDAPRETRLGYRAAEEIEQRAAATELLQGAGDRSAQPGIG